MPMVFTIDRVALRLHQAKLDAGGTEQEMRERLAKYTEETFEDYVEAWEIRTGRPWTAMSRLEAEQLMRDKPKTRRSPAVLSKVGVEFAHDISK